MAGFAVAVLLSAAPATSGDSLVTLIPPRVGPPPVRLRLDPFYTKYLDAGGIPILSATEVSDRALVAARSIVLHMLAKRLDLREELARQGVRVAVIGEAQRTTDIPEQRDLNRAFPETDWNARTRGVGATSVRPVTSCGEENLLRLPLDRYRGENILVHEFGHTIHKMALARVDSAFAADLGAAYAAACRRGLWANTYAGSNVEEYWAEGVQDWFDANLESTPPNGIHNAVNTRAELKTYDPALYRLLARVFPDDDWRPMTEPH